MNSKLMNMFMKILNPTVTFQVGDIARVPYLAPEEEPAIITTRVDGLVALARTDWNEAELSWDFELHPLMLHRSSEASLRVTYDRLCCEWNKRVLAVQQAEEANNRLFLLTCGLTDELTSDVSLSEIALNANPVHRYGSDISDDERKARLQTDTLRELLSYAIGCMMGRYSLDKPGLIYAHSGNQGFDPSQYETFHADDDGIITLLDTDWGVRDDAANRVVEFIGVAEVHRR